jgi:putative FmdB family regulatory protein
MPFYEYECQSCKFYSEVMQKISDEPLKKCPSCGKNTMKKLISAPNFRLKGSGWYETDFKSDNENKRNLAGQDKEESKASEGASSDAAPAAKASESKTPESKPVVESKPSVGTKPSVSAKKPAARAASSSKPAAKKPAARPSRPVAKKKSAKKARR